MDGAPADERAGQRLNGQVAGPLACTLYVYADPAGAIAETTRANNLAGITIVGGSGIDRVRFFVAYDGERHWACTDQDENPSCNWSIPAGLASQELLLTINVLDNVGNISYDAGGPISVFSESGEPGARLTASPTSVSADGKATATITLSGAPVGHQVSLYSSRHNTDILDGATGTVDSNGRFVTTIRSATPGEAIITAHDLTTDRASNTWVSVSFTPVGEPGGPRVVISQEPGFDKCDAPSAADMLRP